MTSLARLYERSAEYDLGKEDVAAHVGDVRFTSGGIAIHESLLAAKANYGMTGWATGQACNKLGPPDMKYIRQCPGWLRAVNFEYWRERLPQDRKWFVRLYGDDCRALLSDRYTPFASTQMLEWVMECIGNQETVEPYLDPHTMHVKVLWPGEKFGEETYRVGAYIGNGEIGNRLIRVLPAIQTSSCLNSLIIREINMAEGEGCVIRHIDKTNKWLEASVKYALAGVFQCAEERREEIAQAMLDELPDFSGIVEKFGSRKGLSDDIQDNILIGSERKMTRMGFINGLTWAAGQQNDHELMVDMQGWAGSILVDRNSLFGKAAEMAQVPAEDRIEVEV